MKNTHQTNDHFLLSIVLNFHDPNIANLLLVMAEYFRESCSSLRILFEQAALERVETHLQDLLDGRPLDHENRRFRMSEKPRPGRTPGIASWTPAGS